MKYAIIVVLSGCELFVSVPNGQLASSDAMPDGGGPMMACTESCASPTPVCDTSSGSCVECVVSTDCTSATAPNCDMNVCRGCEHDAECPTSNVCLQDGTCADPARVLYASATGTAATCTAADPCPIDTALNAVSATQDIVHLAAGTYTRSAMTTVSVPTTVTGEGAILTNSAASFVMWYTMNGSALTLMNLDLELNGNGRMFGAECTGGGALTLYKMKVEHGNGIFIQGCALTVDRSTIDDNIDYSFYIQDAQVKITNSFITNNGGMIPSTGGFNLFAGNTGTIDHTTFTANHASMNSSIAAVHCVDGAVAFTNSIVFNNTAPEIDAGCTLQHSISGTYAGTNVGNLAADPMFMSATDFHIQATSPARMLADPTSMLNIDFDGERRPNPTGTASDSGADEVP
ncbi:MAG: hypothetical protein QM831_39580 [Kofleriaceae bacterium]